MLISMYKRILLKLSGEQLQGDLEGGLDKNMVRWIANQIKPVVGDGTQVAIMVGGGNYVRGREIVGDGVAQVTADNVGMLSTLINALTVSDVFNDDGLVTRPLSSIEVNQFIDQYTFRRALSHLAKGRVVIVGGGIGRPFLTTDTAAVNLALELDCDVIIKTTKVDGVYDKDPMTNPDAVKFDTITYTEVLTNPDMAVMDHAAVGLASEKNIPVIICDLLTDGNIARAASGQNIGTKIS